MEKISITLFPDALRQSVAKAFVKITNPFVNKSGLHKKTSTDSADSAFRDSFFVDPVSDGLRSDVVTSGRIRNRVAFKFHLIFPCKILGFPFQLLRSSEEHDNSIHRENSFATLSASRLRA